MSFVIIGHHSEAMVNVSRTHMSRIETADCAVSLDVVFDICDALFVKPCKIFDFRD